MNLIFLIIQFHYQYIKSSDIADIYLPANSYISTGTCTIVEPSHKGDKVCADFGKLGKVNINFN